MGFKAFLQEEIREINSHLHFKAVLLRHYEDHDNQAQIAQERLTLLKTKDQLLKLLHNKNYRTVS